jgi:hypothetical protein
LAGATNTPHNNSFTVAAADVPLAGSRVAAWYAEDLTTAYGLANNATVGTSGVSEWVDRINGIHAVIDVGAPKFQLNVENGLPSVKFAGTDRLSAGQFTALMTAFNSQTYSVYFVVRNVLSSGLGAVISARGGTGMYIYVDGTNIGQFNGLLAPLTVAQATPLFSGGFRGSLKQTGGNPWDDYGRVVVKGCAVWGNAGTSSRPKTAGANDILLGGPSWKGELLEIHIWPNDMTHAQDIQFHKYVCDKYNKPYPWAGQSYFPVLSGDSISQGSLAASAGVSTGFIVANTLGLGYGQWINASTASITIDGIIAKDAVALSGLPQQLGITTKIHEFEWVNSRTLGGTSVSTKQQTLCGIYYGLGFNKVILGTTIDYGSRTNVGGQSKSGYCALLAALPAGTYDLLNSLHLDSTIGVDGTAPDSGSNTYFVDSIAHPTGLANFPTVQSGQPYLAAMISTAFAAA